MCGGQLAQQFVLVLSSGGFDEFAWYFLSFVCVGLFSGVFLVAFGYFSELEVLLGGVENDFL